MALVQGTIYTGTPDIRDNNYRSESYVGDDAEYDTSTLDSGSGNGYITHAEGTRIDF